MVARKPAVAYILRNSYYVFKIFNYIFTFSFQLIAHTPAEMYADSYF